MNQPFIVALALVLGGALGYVVRQTIAARRKNSLETKLQEEARKAKNEAQEIILEAKNKAVLLLEEARGEEKERKTSLTRIEERLLKKEENLTEREKELQETKKGLKEEEDFLGKEKEAAANLKEEVRSELSRVANLSREEAKQKLLGEIKSQHKEELLELLHQLSTERREEIEKKSVEIITNAIQRYARSHVSELTTSIFTLPSEDLKGKIIGREGRNIRTIERLTGVELIVDETPETIILSSFDPFRREVARLALQKLIKDGRIQPAKIEEKVEEAQAELEKRVYEIGEEAAYEVGVFDLPKEIIHLLGRLHFRTSFGQNVLVHSIEMAHLASMMAAELGINVEVAKKGALLHDIGKAIDHEVEGTHVDLGRKILKKYGISDTVVTAMESHHDDYPFSSPEAFVVAAADALSAARPGARRGTLEHYLKRLEDLEKITSSFPGVKQSYAVSAGRELRVFVIPEKIDDFGALQLARDISARIQSELNYPGEIKVTVIRETRAVEYAK
ncbi:MAG: ribonuclease Y [Candidatus Colwellbacteria bacterium RBG_13_48_8]|uniref:Ribonuclease Y n=1 Tax=Candidatus Colwellbacteria bacterium RBG_13_48_8 TaxID=1797685 RepID=A0A1G1YZA6_9BACT|nr:MAG: ribonuclease Y [Candidatus Colwellbacteria bacterium RBG_13_48_8]